MRESKKNNKGFSLVEMLVAITILVIVVAPLTKVLVSSSKVNQKTKRVMSATEMAQNMFESIDSKSPEAAIVELSSLVKSKDVTLDKAQSLIPGGMSYDKVHEYLDVSVDGSTGKTIWTEDGTGGGLFVKSVVFDDATGKYRCKGFKESADGKYVFAIEGLRQQNTCYDVVVKFDASEYNNVYKPADATPLYATDYVTIPKIYNVNGAYDGVHMEGSLVLNNVLSGEFCGKQVGNGKTEAEILKDMKRTYTLELKDIGTSGTSQIVANLTKKYEYKGSNLITGYDGKFEDTAECIFDSSQYGAAPRNLFIYYTPNYNSTSAGDGALDHFVINNMLDYEVNIYIIRMEQSGSEAVALNNLSTELRENKYAATVQIYESDESVIDTKLRTNLDDNIMKVNTISDYKYSARNSHLITYKVNNLSSTVVDANLEVKGVDAQDEEERVYEVTVDVYMGKSTNEKGDHNYNVSYEGAVKSNFPEGAKLATFTGRIIQ